MKKLIAILLVIALTASVSIAGTMAYLTSEDEDVNVMTLGNVKIEQNEHQRVDTTKAGTLAESDIEAFEQGKPLNPYVDVNMNNAMKDDYEEVTFPSGQTSKLFIGENAIDKMVSVTNTGMNDAYVRTIIALEAPTQKIDISFASGTAWGIDNAASISDVEINGVKYDLLVAVYKDKLAPRATTPYSLLQFSIDWTATNEDIAAYGETYDIPVLSQAVQTAGFADAATALNAAFGEVTAENVKAWFEDLEVPVLVDSFDELKDAAKNGGNYVLTSDIHIEDKSDFFYGSYVTAIYNDMTLDLNGHSITLDVPTDKVADAPILFYVYGDGASLTVVGDGDVIAKNDAFLVFPRSVSEGAYIYGGNWYNNDDTSGTKNDINAIVYSQTNSNIHIYGGTFTFKNVNGHCGGFNVYDNSGAEIVLHEGVLLSNSNYYTGSDADEIHLAEGCELQEVNINGETWYQVVKK